jgi:hypothetical protein
MFFIVSPPLIIPDLLLNQLLMVPSSKRLHALSWLFLVLLVLLEHIFDIEILLVRLLFDLIVEIVKIQPFLPHIELCLWYHPSLKDYRRVNASMLFRVVMFFWLLLLLLHLIKHILRLRCRVLLLRILLVGLHHLVKLTDLIRSVRFFGITLLFLEHFCETKRLVFLFRRLKLLGRLRWHTRFNYNLRLTLLLLLIRMLWDIIFRMRIIR